MPNPVEMLAIITIFQHHETALTQQTWDQLPKAIRELRPRPSVVLVPEIEDIERWLEFRGGDGEREYLALQPLTVLELRELYPEEFDW